MARKSKRELERAVEDLDGGAVDAGDGPDEIVIRHHRVATSWSDDGDVEDGADRTDSGPDEELEEVQRVWRDRAGGWHAETDRNPDGESTGGGHD